VLPPGDDHGFFRIYTPEAVGPLARAAGASVVLALLFAAFGGFGESLYAVGVAHANDRAQSIDYVALSSTLLFVWALGGAIGPAAGALVMELTRPGAFFVYAVVLALTFTLFAIWRLTRRKLERVLETREEFLTYPQTSPEIYAWLPYHKESPGQGTDLSRAPVPQRDVDSPNTERALMPKGTQY